MTHPEGGLFGIDLIPGIDLDDFLPPVVSEALKGTVERILDPETDVSIGDPQPADRPIPVEPGSNELSAAVRLIDGLLSALGLILKFGALVPDETEGMIRKLAGALNTIRGWLTGK